MKISSPELERIDGRVRLSARVETERATSVPERAWFEVPEAFEEMIYTGIESFLAALLPYAMYLGEDIRVDAPVSAHFAYHAPVAAQVLNALQPVNYHPISLHYGELANKPQARAGGVGTMFSGGVDSYHTLMRHLPENQAVPEYAVTHGIYVFGFVPGDVQPDSYRRSLAVYRDVFDQLGLALIPAAYNLAEFRPPRRGREIFYWDVRTHPFGLVGLGHFLGIGLGRLLIPSSQVFNAYGYNFGGDHEIQSSLSTEWLEIIPDGATEDRSVKTLAVADWPVVHTTLRVCWWESDGVKNCGNCPKCLRTMTTLAAAGKLEPFTTFPKPFRPGRILTRLTTTSNWTYLPGMRRLALENGRGDLGFLIRIALMVAKLRGAVRSLITRVYPGFLRRAL